MATEVIGKPYGLRHDILAIYLLLVFGWAGSPGEWVVWAWLLQEAHAAFWPEDPLWNGSSGFFSHFLVDDQILVEPDLGCRRWMSARCADRNTVAALGSGAINQEKNAEEGAWEEVKLC